MAQGSDPQYSEQRLREEVSLVAEDQASSGFLSRPHGQDIRTQINKGQMSFRM